MTPRLPIGPCRAALAVCIVLAAPLSAQAGEIYGTISEAGKPLVKQVVTITCDGGVRDAKPTDDYGSYRLFVRVEGLCQITVLGAQAVSVRAYNSAQRYNFELTRVGGKPTLQRR